MTIEVVDADGVAVPSGDALVEVRADGPTRVLALGNGDPRDHTPYGIPERRALRGMLLTLVQSGEGTGPVRVTARIGGVAPGLGRLLRGEPE